jgi:hypothetical protein
MNREKFNDFDNESKSICISCIVIALILFVVELSVLYLALTIAWNVSNSNTERFLHIILALNITLPYLLLNLLFNENAKRILM